MNASRQRALLITSIITLIILVVGGAVVLGLSRREKPVAEPAEEIEQVQEEPAGEPEAVEEEQPIIPTSGPGPGIQDPPTNSAY